MSDMPSGTVTFLFTDIEGSTRLWEDHPEAMRVALARHDAILRSAIVNKGGAVFKTMGDAFYAAFPTPLDALLAALYAQLTLTSEPWPEATVIRVRMALHMGAAEIRDNDYFGQPLNKVARLLSTGHGGQMLLSNAVQELVRDILPPHVNLQFLGEHRLKDLNRPEQVFQLLHPDLPANFPPLKSLNNPDLPNNLPQQTTSFVGRDRELVEIKDLLAKNRLLTLAGMGGCGKTRLALQTAADVMEDYPDGVWLVELAPLSDSSLVLQAIAFALRVQEKPKQTLQQSLTEHLKSKRQLLILDNCEHLLSACAQVAATLLRSCSDLKILATSRETLGIAGEQIYRVLPLSVPDLKHAASIQDLTQCESVRLFIERALLIKSDFTVTTQNAPALAHICHRLDGIPLAIELAAARLRSLSAEDINVRLLNRFRLLTGGDRTALPRQQTLQAAIDWSYDLLSIQERSLLNRLSIFAGGWTLQAAEAVCVGKNVEEEEVFDLLSSLVDKSLVIYEEHGEHSRYRLLETLGQYGRERLSQSQEEQAIREQHCGYFVGLAEQAEPHLQGPEQALWLNRLQAENDNFQTALAWSANSELQMRFVKALWRFWYVRGLITEGRAWAEEALKQSDTSPTALRARVLHGAAVLVGFHGDLTSAQSLLEDSLSIFEELDAPKGVADTLHTMGIMARRQGNNMRARTLYEKSLATRRLMKDNRGIAAALTSLGIIMELENNFDAARAYYDEGATLFRELEDKYGLAALLTNMGALAQRQEDLKGARVLYEESLQIKREIGNKDGIVVCAINLADIARIQGDYHVMWSLLTECLNVSREAGDSHLIACTLEACAQSAASQGEPQSATQMFGAAETLREAGSSSLQQDDAEEYRRNIVSLQNILGGEAYTLAWETGKALSLEESLNYALQNIMHYAEHTSTSSSA